MKNIEKGEQGKNLALHWEAETGSAGEQPARTTLATGDDRAGALDSAPVHHPSFLL